MCKRSASFENPKALFKLGLKAMHNLLKRIISLGYPLSSAH